MELSRNWIIAEIGSVHDGSFGNAINLMEAAAACGADCVKFQTHIAEAETLADAPAPSYFSAEPRMSYFRRTGFTLDQWKKLAQAAKDLKVLFLSSPFSLEAVDLLEEVGMGAYKIPSGEVTNLPLMEKIARTKKPALLSSGMSTWSEIEAAAAKLMAGGPLCVMQCTSAYPCPSEKVGLNNLAEIRRRFPNAAIGYSDHTLSMAAPLAAAALGATVIEKHFTFSKLMYGSDAKHSMEPGEFKELCSALRETWMMLANPVNKDELTVKEMGSMKGIFQKSVVTARALSSGHVIGNDDLAFKKPGDGISAARYQELLGKRLKRDLAADHKLSMGDFE